MGRVWRECVWFRTPCVGLYAEPLIGTNRCYNNYLYVYPRRACSSVKANLGWD